MLKYITARQLRQTKVTRLSTEINASQLYQAVFLDNTKSGSCQKEISCTSLEEQLSLQKSTTEDDWRWLTLNGIVSERNQQQQL